MYKAFKGRFSKDGFCTLVYNGSSVETKNKVTAVNSHLYSLIELVLSYLTIKIDCYLVDFPSFQDIQLGEL